MRSVLLRTAKKSGSKLISINDQVARSSESAARFGCEKIRCLEKRNKSDVVRLLEISWHGNSFPSSEVGEEREF